MSLKVADIDRPCSLSRMLIHVRHGKGAKDRTVMLSPQLLAILRTYTQARTLYVDEELGLDLTNTVYALDWRLARPREWLFPGRDESKPIDVQVLHAACRSATKAAGLAKRVTVHKDPESGKTLVFITNNFSLPAATICALYKSRSGTLVH